MTQRERNARRDPVKTKAAYERMLIRRKIVRLENLLK
jgi:hypothetical protein